MQALLDGLQSVGIFLLFLLGRFMLLLLVLALLSAVFFVGLTLVRAVLYVRARALGLTKVAGLRWRAGLHYSPGHTWVEIKARNGARVGFDDVAQRLLAGVSAIKLPEPGTVLREGLPAAEVLCGGHRAVIPAPVSGTVIAANRALGRHPSAIHRDPYFSGWLFTVKRAVEPGTRLLTGEAARKWFGDETLRLTHFVERELGVAAADGGELVGPLPSLLTVERWKALTRAFLEIPRPLR
jgi:glycine cleavage system H protein